MQWHTSTNNRKAEKGTIQGQKDSRKWPSFKENTEEEQEQNQERGVSQGKAKECDTWVSPLTAAGWRERDMPHSKLYSYIGCVYPRETVPEGPLHQRILTSFLLGCQEKFELGQEICQEVARPTAGDLQKL